GAGVHRLHWLLGMAAIGHASPRLLRAVRLWPHVLHAGHQMLAVRSGGKRSRETALGYYMVAASIGQGLGPFVVGWLGGAAALPPTGLLFTIGLVVAGASVIVAGLIRPAAVKADQHDAGDLIPIGRLLALRGFAAVMVSSVVTITALDL